MQYSATATQQSAPVTSSLIDSAGISDSSDTSGFVNPLTYLRNKRMEADTIRYLDSLFERARRARWRFESQWYVNLSYYFGRQWINWLNGADPGIARLHEPQAPPWRVRLVINRIKPAIRREMSKVMKEKPTAFVIPSSTDDSDIAAARAGEAIFEHLWRTLDMKTELWMAQFWRCICGTGFIKDWWDPRGEGPDGMGTVGTEVPSPFHLYFSNLEQPKIDRQEYIVHLSVKSPEEVETMFGVKVAPDAVERGGGVIESQYLRALNLEPGNVSQVCCKEIWIKPNVRFPRGAMYVWAGGKILYCAMDPATGDPVWPLYKKEYPFTKFDGVPTGRFYGDSTIIDLLPIQKEYNRTRSQIIESKNQMSKPQLLAPNGSIDPKKITSEPGLVITYRVGFDKPTPLKLENLPPYVLQELDRCLLDMADISGQHEVSTGTVPQGVTAASALSFIQESDDTMIAPIINSLEAGVERLGRHFLCHAHLYWDGPHMVKVLGPDNTWESREFSKLDLRGNTDLNVQAGSAMPRSIAAKQALIMELLKLQVITPEQGLRYLEMAETGQMYEELQLDRRQAERENMKMSDPEIVQPDFGDMFNTLLEQIGPGAPGAGPPAGATASPEGGLLGLPPAPAPTESPAFPGGSPGGMGAPTGPQMPPGIPGFPGLEGLDLGGMGGGMEQMPPDIAGETGMPGQVGMPPMIAPPPQPIVQVNSWDNHEIHIEVHNNFRKRQEFESLPPHMKMEFERHVELHRAALGLPPTVNPEQMHQMLQLQQNMPQPPGLEGGMPTNEPGAVPADGSQAPGSESEAPEPSGVPL